MLLPLTLPLYLSLLSHLNLLNLLNLRFLYLKQKKAVPTVAATIPSSDAQPATKSKSKKRKPQQRKQKKQASPSVSPQQAQQPPSPAQISSPSNQASSSSHQSSNPTLPASPLPASSVSQNSPVPSPQAESPAERGRGGKDKKSKQKISQKKQEWRPKQSSPASSPATSPAKFDPTSPSLRIVISKGLIVDKNKKKVATSDDEPLTLNRTNDVPTTPEKSNETQSESTSAKKKAKMDEVTYLQWNNRYLASPPLKTRSRKQTSFLRPTEDPRGGNNTSNNNNNSSRSRKAPSRSASSNTVDWIEEGSSEDEDESSSSENGEEVKDVASPSPSSSPSNNKPIRAKKRNASQPRRSIRPKNIHKPPVIVSDSSPSPDPSLNDPIPSPSSIIKEEPKDDEDSHSEHKGLVGRKKANHIKKGKGKKDEDKKEESNDEHLQEKLEQWLDALDQIKDEKGELKCGHFQKRMDKSNFGARRDWEKYKKVIRKPISLTEIRQKTYKSVNEISQDFQKMIKNAKRINSEVVNCLEHVDWMEQHCSEWLKTL